MRVLVGITGGVAAYKAAEIIRELTESGHEVKAVPTANALRFIGAATLEALTHNSVSSELYENVEDVRHIELAKWAELVLVAPATASFLARTSAGLADDLLANIVLATKAPLVISPAMHTEMWENAATVRNVEVLRSRGVLVIDPASGRLTGSDTGVGRLPDPSYIVQSALSKVAEQDLTGKRVLIVAGGTREAIDPVRFLGNRSSGKQGIALVEEAVSRGAQVQLVAANFDYYSPECFVVRVSSTSELMSAIDALDGAFDIVVMPAAVADFKVETPSATKVKKVEGQDSMTLELVKNPDVITALAKRIHGQEIPGKIVGFAAETMSIGELVDLASAKRAKKGLDIIVANDVTKSAGFDSDENSVVIISGDGRTSIVGSKRTIAKAIFDAILQ
jgi:phosphopantothenoylcysteine decarboxylase/phosphopantothenate--cysteine ligase